MSNKRDKRMLTNACVSTLNHAEWFLSVEQSIKSKTLNVIATENKALIMLDHTGNRSKIFEIKIAEQLFQFPHSLLFPDEINTPQ